MCLQKAKTEQIRMAFKILFDLVSSACCRVVFCVHRKQTNVDPLNDIIEFKFVSKFKNQWPCTGIRVRAASVRASQTTHSWWTGVRIVCILTLSLSNWMLYNWRLSPFSSYNIYELHIQYMQRVFYLNAPCACVLLNMKTWYAYEIRYWHDEFGLFDSR